MLTVNITAAAEQLIGTSSCLSLSGQSYKPAGTPEQGFKIRTVPANPGRMVSW